MAELKDTAIKLFGKTIPLPLDQLEDMSSANESSCSVKLAAIPQGCSDENSGALHEKKSEKEREEQDGNRESSGGEINNGKQDDATNQISEDSIHPTTSSGIGDNHKSPSAEGEISSSKSSKNGEQSDTSVSGEKTLKKPDKILPCPRCNSMDTKFCYFNNYNVNQPRHFCKNCQRYWTAGGTMRNVPVGAGRRKNKSSSALHYRQIMVSEALRAVEAHAANGIHNPSWGTNGTVLTFGRDSPLCNSVSQVLNLSEKTQDGVRNGHHRPEIRILVSRGGTTENGDDCTSRSSASNLNSSEKGFPPQIPCFPGHPWPYPWTSGMPPPTFCPSGFPVPVYAAPNYWGCTVPNPWNVPRCISPPSTSLPDCTQSSSPKSPLGKHSREGNVLNQANSDEPSRESNGSERSVLLPKTLRIDDPSEAAKSSIWATLGIKREKTNSFNGGSLFKGFQSKNKDGNYKAETSPLLQANPAALSRSLNFHEST